MVSTVVHFVVVEHGRRVAPLCGDWRDGTSWTTAPDAVRCPACDGRIRSEVPAARRVSVLQAFGERTS